VIARRCAALAAAAVVAACHREPTAVCPGCGFAPPPPTEALVGFHDSVNAALLYVYGLTIEDTRSSPPAARVRGDTAAFDRVAADPQVAYVFVLWLVSTDDSTGAFVGFHDRPSGADTLSDADRQLVASVGARIEYVYSVIPDIAVVLPVWAVPSLVTSPLVSGWEPDMPAWTGAR